MFIIQSYLHYVLFKSFLHTVMISDIPIKYKYFTGFQVFQSNCDGKIIKIPRREFIFRTCEDGAVWHLIPRRISPCSESFLGHLGTGI